VKETVVKLASKFWAAGSDEASGTGFRRKSLNITMLGKDYKNALPFQHST
jgi:hypothetical protein